METKEKVFSKIQKLLRLADSSNPHEAAEAMAKAQMLMSQHKIEHSAFVLSEEEKENKFSEEDFQISQVANLGRVPMWRSRLALHIAKANSCRSYFIVGKGIFVLGTQEDVQITKYLYYLFCEEIDRLTKTKGYRKGGRYANSFRNGVVSALGEKFSKIQEQAESNVYEEATRTGKELVQIDRAISFLKNKETALEKSYSRLGTKTISRSANWTQTAYNHGYREGKKINVNRPKKVLKG